MDAINEYGIRTENRVVDKPYYRKWFPTTVRELYSYIAIRIYIALYHKNEIE